MPSIVVLQSAHNEIFDFLVDEAARCFVHFITHYGVSSHRFSRTQSAVFALTGYEAMLCPTNISLTSEIIIVFKTI